MIGTLANLVTTVTAVVGLFVAALAFRGYRQNDSGAMLALSVGIVAIAVVPFLVTELAGRLLALTDAQALVAILLSHTLGLAAIYRSFRN
jgi:hypothetical protein